MGLRSMIESFRKKNAILKEIEAQDAAEIKLANKKKTANERALEKILEQKRQEQITAQLNEYTKQDEDDYWHKDVITQKNIFKEKKTMLNQKCMFVNQPNIFTRQKRLF